MFELSHWFSILERILPHSRLVRFTLPLNNLMRECGLSSVTRFVLSLSTVTVSRLVLRVERLLVTRGANRDMHLADWESDSYELQSPY